MLIANVVRSSRTGRIAGDNPWGADTLEWGTSSPPPVYNFLQIPVVEGRHALWQRSEDAPVVTGIRTDKREVLVTDVMDAEPVHRTDMPKPTIWPFISAVVTAGFFVTSIFTPWALVYWAVPVFIALTGWFWPKRGEEGDTLDDAAVTRASAA
jgi:cytochrome c oxidase subunit I+III